MSIRKETIPEAIERFSRECMLDREQIAAYADAFAAAWRREKVKQYVRNFRERKNAAPSDMITPVITDMITPVITSDKEERSEKENLPPTPPIREKGKKEETPPSAATRAACTREDERIPTWEQVKARAEVSLKCKDLDWLREWFAEQECSLWRDGKGNALLNWGRALAIAWRYREIDDARRDPERLLADERRNEPEPGSDLIARQMAELSKEVRR